VRTSVDVHNYLVEREAPHEVFSARGRLRSPERIAAVLDLPPGEVGKVVVYEGPGGPVAAVVPSGKEPDPARVRRAAGQPGAEQVSGDRASELTGYLPESIPPAGLPGDFMVILDRSLDRDAVLYFPGGEARAVLKIRGKDLVRATSAKVAPIALPSERT
jgi:prolyl-tRNA editing enzyme YbaK/EbsC (Cys-tRNA(Pro) deacylase)